MSQERFYKEDFNSSHFDFASFAKPVGDPQKEKIYSYKSEQIKESLQD